MKINQIHFSKLFEITSRLYVFVFLNIYGLGKISGGQFYRKGQLPPEVASIPLGEASAYELGWTFMGYSFFYILFVGVSQVIGAWLLLWNRTKLLGVTILIPIMLNIIVFDIIFLEQKGALVNASLYFVMLLYILFFNRQQVLGALHHLTTPPKPSQADMINSPILKIGLVTLIAIIIFGMDQFFVRMVGH